MPLPIGAKGSGWMVPTINPMTEPLYTVLVEIKLHACCSQALEMLYIVFEVIRTS